MNKVEIKAEKIYIAGIITYRVSIEINNKSRDVIKVESWSKKQSGILADQIYKAIKTL